MSKTKVFSSEELEQAYARAQKGLSNYQNRLDGVSQDIKTLEKSFQAANFNVETWVVAEEECEGPEINGNISQYRHEIGWSKTNGSFRLMYRQSFCEHYMEVAEGCVIAAPGEFGAPEYDEVFQKPLIETPVEARLKMHKHLPKLVLAIGRATDPELDREVSEELRQQEISALEEAYGELFKRRKARRTASGTSGEQATPESQLVSADGKQTIQ